MIREFSNIIKINAMRNKWIMKDRFVYLETKAEVQDLEEKSGWEKTKGKRR